MPALQSAGKVSVLAGACLPALAHAHAFDDRYLLPGPLRHFVLGAAAVVALSFLVIALANWWKPGPAPSTKPDSRWCISLGPVLPLLGYLLRPLSVLVLCVTIEIGRAHV